MSTEPDQLHSHRVGPGLHLYLPRRWLSSDEAHSLGITAPALPKPPPFLSFGAGRHQCIGDYFAQLELWRAMAVVFSRFEVSAVTPTSSIPYTDGVVMKPSAPVWVYLRRR